MGEGKGGKGFGSVGWGFEMMVMQIDRNESLILKFTFIEDDDK